MRILQHRHGDVQLGQTHTRRGAGTSDSDVSGQAAHEGAANGHRFGHRRPQPCHGAALVQSRKRHDGHRQELQAADRTDREDRTGKGISGKRTYVVRYGQDYRVLPCCFNIILPPGKYCRQRIIRIFAYRRTS